MRRVINGYGGTEGTVNSARLGPTVRGPDHPADATERFMWYTQTRQLLSAPTDASPGAWERDGAFSNMILTSAHNLTKPLDAWSARVIHADICTLSRR